MSVYSLLHRAPKGSGLQVAPAAAASVAQFAGEKKMAGDENVSPQNGAATTPETGDCGDSGHEDSGSSCAWW